MASLTRACIATGIARLDSSVRPSEYAKKNWDDQRVELILRAATSPATLSNTPALTQVAAAFLASLTPTSAGADLLGRGVRLNFDGAAQINVPGIALPTAGFVAEGAPIPVVQATTTGPTLNPHKLAAISVLTSEILRSSNAETLVKQALVEACGPALDAQLFSANAATADAPAGLLNSIAPLTPAAAGEKQGAVVDDLQVLIRTVAPVAGNSDIVIVAAPAQAVAIALRIPREVPYGLLTSTTVPDRTVIAVAANSLVSAVEGVPQVDAATSPELHMETAPGAIGTSGVVASIYQSDKVALRLRWNLSFALRSSAGLAWMQNVNW
jgi:Phage capsid family